MTGSAQAGSPRLGAEPAGLGRGRMRARVTEGGAEPPAASHRTSENLCRKLVPLLEDVSLIFFYDPRPIARSNGRSIHTQAGCGHSGFPSARPKCPCSSLKGTRGHRDAATPTACPGEQQLRRRPAQGHPLSEEWPPPSACRAGPTPAAKGCRSHGHLLLPADHWHCVLWSLILGFRSP